MALFLHLQLGMCKPGREFLLNVGGSVSKNFLIALSCFPRFRLSFYHLNIIAIKVFQHFALFGIKGFALLLIFLRIVFVTATHLIVNVLHDRIFVVPVTAWLFLQIYLRLIFVRVIHFTY